MRQINQIIVHCSATKWGQDIGVKQIRKWHLERGWRDIGYHYVIRLNGTIEAGRPLEQTGAHCKGQNKDSIGICLVGGLDGTDAYTDAQWRSLRILINGLRGEFGSLDVKGHNDYTNAKTCPNFKVKEWFYG